MAIRCRDRLQTGLNAILGVVAVSAAVPAAGSAQIQRAQGPSIEFAAEVVDTPLVDDRTRAVHLLQRASFGPLPEDIDEVMLLGVEGWIDQQLDPFAIDDAKVERLIEERFPAATMNASELLELHPPNQIMQSLRRLARDSTSTEAERREAQQVLRRSNPGRIVQQLTGARLARAAHSERQLEEMMTEFWFDHFNVDFRKNQLRCLVADYESSAIRPNVFGSFYDLLVATATHPAMLVYLDNAQSVAPQPGRPQSTPRFGMRRRIVAGSPDRLRIGSRGRQQASRQRIRANERGLNENYARELLELHTLGVDGGYTQADVIDVARAFTGWGVSRPAFNRADLRGMAGSAPTSLPALVEHMENASYDGAFEFLFRRQLHDPADKGVLGIEIAGSQGMDDGLAILRMLATHPSTAKHIATQLVTRFVSDDPPQDMVDELASVFLETNGDLAEVTRALFTSAHFYSAEVIGSKVKSPFVLIASAVRMTEAEVVNVRPLAQTLASLGEQPYLAEAPIGYPETSSDWVSGGAMLNRMDFGQSFASGQIRGLAITGEGGLLRGNATQSVVGALADRLLPGGRTEDAAVSVNEVIAEESIPNPRDRAIRALGLLLGSPDFQIH